MDEQPRYEDADQMLPPWCDAPRPMTASAR